MPILPHSPADRRLVPARLTRCANHPEPPPQYKIPKSTSVKDIRQLLKSNNTVQPPEWFQAILAQGCLLLNASMTASTTSAPPGAATSAAHARFWKPIIHEVVEQVRFYL